MLTYEEERELEQQADLASQSLLLFLFVGRRGFNANRKVEFDPRKGVWRIDGKVVSLTTIRVMIAQIENIAAKRIALHNAEYQAGRISAAEWARRMNVTLRVSHLLTASLAVGGIDKASVDMVLTERIAKEMAYLENFKRDLRAGKISDAKMNARAKSYTLAVGVTYWVTDQELKKNLRNIKRVTKIRNAVPLDELEIKQLYKEARRYRRASESCDGCKAYSGYWMPIDEMPAIGSLDCGSRCRCFIAYR